MIGGGLAGMAAAVRLAEAGWAVTLLETRKRLGGRASSFFDREAGQWVDNCQHVLLGCCTNLVDLYRRLGVLEMIRWDRRLVFADKRGHRDVLERDELPAPAHLTRSVLGFRTLSLAEKAAIGRAMVRILRLGETGRQRLAGTTFLDWLREQRQPAGAVRKFWEVFIVSALNEKPERASAAYAVQVFQQGLLAHREAYLLGTPRVPLLDLYGPATEALRAAGGEVRLGTSVDELLYDGTRVTGARTASGETLSADAVVSALPYDRLDRVVGDPMREADPRLAGARHLSPSPILGIHLWVNPPVMELPHLILVDSPLQWVFNKGLASDGTQHVHGVISAAEEWVGEPASRILEMAVRELADYLPRAKGCRVVRGRAIKEKRATFSVEPEADRWRPATTGPLANLYLAGDWCRTGWPATMEGAVRSGYFAASALRGTPVVQEDLAPSEIYAMLEKR